MNLVIGIKVVNGWDDEIEETLLKVDDMGTTTIGDLKCKIESLTKIAVADQRFVPSISKYSCEERERGRSILFSEQEQEKLNRKSLHEVLVVVYEDNPNTTTTTPTLSLIVFIPRLPHPTLFIAQRRLEPKSQPQPVEEPAIKTKVDDVYMDAGLLGSNPDDPDYDEADREADAVWDAIDAKLKTKKMKKNQTGSGVVGVTSYWNSLKGNLKEDLFSLSPEDWDKI